MSRFIVWLILFLPFSGWCQLSGFDFGIAVQNETCSGNGVLTFSPAGVPAGATVTYYVYLEPNLSVPVKTTTTNVATDLASGNYTVIASISLNGEETSVTHTAVIVDQRAAQPVVDFEIRSHNCNNLNEINVVVVSGTVTAYEIYSGPVTAPPQSSGLFTGLVNGEYVFRIYDGCGQAISQTYTAVFNPQPPVISPPDVSQFSNGNCNTFTLGNTISYPEGTVFTYPLTVQYTLHATGAPDVVVTQTITSGDLDNIVISNTFPYTAGAVYTYDIHVVNGCGINYSSNGNYVNPNPTFAISGIPTPCGLFYLTTTAAGYTPPYTITFTEYPTDFIPQSFNNIYPGPYQVDSVNFGSVNQTVPEGMYKAFITDACGRISEITQYEVENIIPVPVAGGHNAGCFSQFGTLTVSIPSRSIVSAIITSAPPAYTVPLPADVSALINSNGILSLTNMPIGTYVFTLVDDCGIEYPNVQGVIGEFEPGDFTAQSKADCAEGMGSVAVTSPNRGLTSMFVTAAPADFPHTLPYDVTNLIASNGKIYMDGLPEGTYTFSGTDGCGINGAVTITITVKTVPNGVFTFRALCNSFNVTLNDPDPSASSATYWLQVEDTNAPGTWLNPETGAVYTEGVPPNAVTAVALTNNFTNINFTYSGRFRILKYFTTFGAANASKDCISQIGGFFEYYYEVFINAIYNIDCTSMPDSVYIDATGLAPLHYSIVDANDASIVLVDNGTNPIFSNLAPGSYRFKVENSCGESKLMQADITTLPDLVDAATPSDMFICVDPGESINGPVDLTVQNPAILNGAIASQYSITYFTSFSDADSDTNPIATPQAYMLGANPVTLYAKLNQIYVNLCPDIVSFNLQVGETPVIGLPDTMYLCEELGSLTIDAGAGFDAYVWQPGGEITPSITVTQAGVYNVTIISNGCSATKDITVIPVEPPIIEDIEIIDWTFDNNSFTVVTAFPDMYVYSIDGTSYQESNTFTGLQAGIYTVYVQDKQGCDATEKKFALLYYPKFFTPNGDSYNETWRIPYSYMEPNLKVYIYDRYGKLITGFPAQSEGWDGTLNGYPLPSTDYWFIVVRQNGQVHKGHFSLIR